MDDELLLEYAVNTATIFFQTRVLMTVFMIGVQS